MTNGKGSQNGSGTSSEKSEFTNDLDIIKEEMALVQQGLQFETVLKERKDPMPYIPRSGRWAIDHWAIFWGVNTDTVNRNNEKIGYEPMKFGNTKVIDAAKFWKRLEDSAGEEDG